MYFVHSYRATPSDANADWVLSTTRYGDDFISSVQQGGVHATQFHPEKSGAAGLDVIRGFLEPEAHGGASQEQRRAPEHSNGAPYPGSSRHEAAAATHASMHACMCRAHDSPGTPAVQAARAGTCRVNWPKSAGVSRSALARFSERPSFPAIAHVQGGCGAWRSVS